MKARPPLRYHGGKWLLAPWIVSHFPAHRLYVEPYGGAASVLLRKPRSSAEIYNDRWTRVVNVFRVLRDPTTAAQLARLLYLTPYARDEFTETDAKRRKTGTTKDVEQARLTIFRSFAGFASASTNEFHPTGFRPVSLRSSTMPSVDWANYPWQIPQFVERLRGVTIENKDALNLIERHDSRDTLFYLDPPYPLATRRARPSKPAFAHEMTDEDHRDLATLLHEVKGMVVLSGYDCPLYQELFGTWTRFEKDHVIDGGRKRVESIWLNPAAALKLPGPHLF